MPIKQKTKHRKQLVSLIRTNTKIDVSPFPLQTKSKTKQTTGNEVIQFVDKHHFFLLSLLCFAFCFVLFIAFKFCRITIPPEFCDNHIKYTMKG